MSCPSGLILMPWLRMFLVKQLSLRANRQVKEEGLGGGGGAVLAICLLLYARCGQRWLSKFGLPFTIPLRGMFSAGGKGCPPGREADKECISVSLVPLRTCCAYLAQDFRVQHGSSEPRFFPT